MRSTRCLWIALYAVGFGLTVAGMASMLNYTDQGVKSRPPYPNGVPLKFDPDGNVQPFPGNTIISHLSTSSEVHVSLLELYDKLRESRFSSLYTLLPPSSWHMTVFEGVCDKVRKPGFWPSDLAMDATLEECNDLFAKKLPSFDLQLDTPFRISIKGFKPLTTGIGVKLEGSTPEGNAALRGLRDRLSGLLHIRHPKHKTYVFHLSIAYFLRHLTEEQDKQLTGLLMDHFKDMPKEFELDRPEYCEFEDMFAFKRQFYLENQKTKP